MNHEESYKYQDRHSQSTYSHSGADEPESTSRQPRDRASDMSNLADHLEWKPPLWLTILESYLTAAKIKDQGSKYYESHSVTGDA